MILLPAIDLLDGQVVRLAQGKREARTVYSKDPIAIAQRFAAAGAQWLHVVDLNGAFDGVYSNWPIAKKIIETCKLQVELSGGIRTEAALTGAISAGASRVVLGTKACEDPEFVRLAVSKHGSAIAVAIDAKANQVVSRGWVSSTALTPVDLARRMADLGVGTLICTDVGRDGMMAGPNLSLLEQVLSSAPVSVIASGGISSIEDLKRLKQLEPRGVKGAIIGKALYEGAIDLAAAIQVANSGT